VGKIFIEKMGIMERKYKKHGFTLIELLVVIAIIAILSAILFPAIRKAIDSARRTRCSNHMRQIAMAFMNYSHSFSGDMRTIPNNATTVYDWARILANVGVLDEAAVFLWSDDPVLKGKTIPKSIKNSSNDVAWRDPSVVCLSNVDPYAPATTTPIAWSRGLDISSGAWSNGVFGSEGGFVAFLDGHVEWFENTTNKLYNSEGTAVTSPVGAATHGSTTPVVTRGTTGE
jgi:prepilin-type N-terminal cleavage/methylation domain-containing protein/prepilin-type processing-associated H-X9-DG protein